MTTSASLCEGPILYFYVFTFYARVNSVLLYFFFIFLFCKHHVVGKDLGIYIELDMSDNELLLLTSALRLISWEAKSQAPIFLCVWLKFFAPYICREC